MDVLELISKRMTNQEIANVLYITISTVKFHVTNLKKKLGNLNRSGLACYLAGGENRMITRKIEPKMVEYLDFKLKENGLAQHAIASRDFRSLLIQAACACVGIREVGGNNQGPMVELIQETIGGHSGEAWCLAFVETIIAYCELKLGVVSRLPATEHCLTAWQTSHPDLHVKYGPLPGAIIIWRHGSSSNGHTGIFLEHKDGIMKCVEGNTESGLSPQGKVERDGGGIYLTNRSMKGTGSLKILGFIKPL
jgi:hypothetical protein